MLLEHQFFLGRGAAARVALLGGAIVAAPDGAESPVPKRGVVGEVMLESEGVELKTVAGGRRESGFEGRKKIERAGN